MISIVTTLYCSEDYIETFYERSMEAIKQLGASYELIFVNDGSPDNSKQVALEVCKRDPNVRLIDLSRNFGHHAAIITGLRAARGELVFLIDSDLEEDPIHLVALSDELKKHADCEAVYGVQQERKGQWFERVSGELYYRIFSLLAEVEYPSNSLTARIMTRKFVDAVLQYPERELDVWCLFSLVGFQQIPLVLDKKSSSKTTYTLARKINIALKSITSISSKPLYLIFLLGLIITAVTALMMLYLIVNRIVHDDVVEGWTSTILSIWLMGGLIIFSIGVIGIYLGKLFNEAKARPRVIINKEYGKPEERL